MHNYDMTFSFDIVPRESQARILILVEETRIGMHV